MGSALVAASAVLSALGCNLSGLAPVGSGGEGLVDAAAPALVRPCPVWRSSKTSTGLAIGPDTSTERWSVALGNSDPGAPNHQWVQSIDIGGDGTIFVGSAVYISAHSPLDGATRWIIARDAIGGAVELGCDGVLYDLEFVDQGYSGVGLFARDPSTGAEIWRRGRLPDREFDLSQMVLGRDNSGATRVYLADTGKSIITAVGALGAVVWQRPIDDDTSAVPLLTTNSSDLVVIGGYKVRLLRAADGSTLWSVPATGSSPRAALAKDGSILVLGSDALHSLSADDGHSYWSVKLPAPPVASVDIAFAQASDGTLRVGAGKQLLSLASDGHLLWTGTSISGSSFTKHAAVDSQGNAFVQAGGGYAGQPVSIQSFDVAGAPRFEISIEPSSPGLRAQLGAMALGNSGSLIVGSVSYDPSAGYRGRLTAVGR